MKYEMAFAILFGSLYSYYCTMATDATEPNISPPIVGAVKRPHKEYVLEDERVIRINYELSLLYNLKDKLTTKEVWIQDSYKYRNPKADLPPDFADKKGYYYDLVGKPLSAKVFIQRLKKEQRENLSKFNSNLPKNNLVEILKKPKGHIKVAKLTEQPHPPQLDLIKQELFKKWPSIGLLDILKETDLFVGFIDNFVASGPKEGLSKDEIKKRTLLAISRLSSFLLNE
jgi:hypothetical protein